MTFRLDGTGDADCDRCGGLIPQGRLTECVQIGYVTQDPDTGMLGDGVLHLCLRGDDTHQRCGSAHVLTTAALAHYVANQGDGAKPVFVQAEDFDPVDPADHLP
jgi:hypothetical protein